MKRPILAYGHKVLRQKCKDIDKDYPNLEHLITDMWETMQSAAGCGLAAPQIGQAIKLFVVDSKTTFENLQDAANRELYFDKDDKGIIEAFINAKIVHRSEELWEDEEGCLSIPKVAQKVKRHWSVTIEYLDKDFEQQTRRFSGTTARIIQHEYDHTEGILYFDYLKPLAKKLMQSKLRKIMRGQVNTAYPMRFEENIEDEKRD